jgi:signal transduction histidine kinase
MRKNHSDRVVVGLLLIAGIFCTELAFSWGLFAYLLAGIYIATTPGKFIHGLILGLVTAAFIVSGYFFSAHAEVLKTSELTVRFLLLFIVGLSVVGRIRNTGSDAYAGQNSLLDSASAEKDEALFKLSQLRKELEILQDEKQRIENELVKGKRLREAMVYHFPDGVICVINKDMKYVVADGPGMQALGFDRLHSGSNAPMIGSGVEIKKAFSGESVSFETVIKGEEYTVNAVPIPDATSQVSEVLIVIRNVTNRKRLENNLFKALEKEKELNLLMSQFVTMASHKFRTPLSTILSSVFLLENNVEADELEKKSYFDKIKRAVHNLTGLLNDFLSLGKLEEGKVKVAFRETEIKSFFQQFLQEIGSIKKEKQKIIFNYDGVACTVLTDQLLLKNIMMSLLSNAIEYSAFDAEIELDVELKQDNLRVRVADHGIGIPEEEQHQIFRRFYRGQNANNIEGTGLGLNIAKKYIRLLKGTIEFTSQVNRGTTFVTNIPVVTLDILEKQA